MPVKKKTCIAASLFAAGFSIPAIADDFKFEAGLAYDRTRLDGSQTITATQGTINDTGSIDTDDVSLFGTWYFAGLSDDEGPRTRAAFVDRASAVTLSYSRTDQSFANTIESTFPSIPSGDFAFDTSGDTYAIGGRFVSRDSGWFANAAYLSTNTRPSGVVIGDTDVSGWSVGVGKYFWGNSAISLDVTDFDNDTSVIAVAFTRLGNLGGDWQYAVDLGYSRTDESFGSDTDSWFAGVGLIPTKDVEFGLRYQDQESRFPGSDSTSIEGYVSWFVTPKFELAARYRVDDVDYLGGASVFPAERVSDADQDSIGLLVNFRF